MLQRRRIELCRALREAITDLQDHDIVPEREDLRAFELVKNRQYFKLDKSRHFFKTIFDNEQVFREAQI